MSQPDPTPSNTAHASITEGAVARAERAVMNQHTSDFLSGQAVTLNGVAECPDGIPDQIDRYRVTKVLGQGGFGIVYLAVDEDLKRLVAIKVPRRLRIASPADAEPYLVEAQILAKLDHPHIVPVHDVGRTRDGLPFVVSKFIEGSNLANRFKNARLGFVEAAQLVATIAEALQHAHQHGLVHRDVKPPNILIDPTGKPYLADFGLALKEEDFGKGPGGGGTPAYMSPEQANLEGHLVDGRSDIYSLGVVLYESLTGRLPFVSKDLHELRNQIATADPRPPRQIDPTVPKELERICLKALSRRASERYTTAQDMADDLWHYGSHLAPRGNLSSRSEGLTVGATAEVRPADSAVAPIQIVPKGLRSFDAHDADFFLELLPGPRDRDGLPDSIRFWKTRIEEVDADKPFRVGLIYGPSGSGKSSLVKAGLLPRLASHVRVLYVEATSQETEARLLRNFRSLQDFAGLTLREIIAALRHGQSELPGQKVLIVLDQFEQWLHAHGREGNSELVQALRQCDGNRVQCVIMVRDDFWLAVSRFMQSLEVPILEGENSRLVDLFDLLHARRVLAAFGRAYGRLPAGSAETYRGLQDQGSLKEEDAFLDQAVAGLAQDGKVVSVRLALFAEMVKGKLWTPATLQEIGGTEGVGVTFLDETFTASTAPPPHRLHQSAAQAVLKALLPQAGADIKGHMRSQQELLEAAGYANRLKDFDDLIHILDSETRLITPTDPEGPVAETGGALAGSAQPTSEAAHTIERGRKYFQLTHDYLVPSLRDWLNRKQKETRRGRAELLLADRSAVWNARSENRQLPSLWQWFSIRRWTSKQNWTGPQRKMMGRATGVHAVRGTAALLLLTVATVLGLTIREQVVSQRLATHAAGLVQTLLNADTAQVPGIVDDLAEYRQWADPLLRREREQAATNLRQKLHASLALLPVDPDQKSYLYVRLLDAAPHEVPVIRDALIPHSDEMIDKLWAVVEVSGKGKEHRCLRAAAALAMYDPNSGKWAKYCGRVALDLVSVNPVYLGHWTEAFRPVKDRLISPLSAIFRDRDADRTAERTLATNLLADYAASEPPVLADLLMDADERQFAVLFEKGKDHGDRLLSGLVAEIDKKVHVVADQVIHEWNGTIHESEAKFKTSHGAVHGKRFEVRLKGGKSYRLTMDSGVLNCLLVVQDGASSELACCGNDAERRHSLFVFTAPKDDAYAIIAASSKGTGFFSLAVVETDTGENAKEDLAKRKANAATALLKMGRPETLWPLLKHSPDPRLRSYLIHRLGPLGADPGALIKRLDEEPDISIRRALLLSLGEHADPGFSLASHRSFLETVQDIYCTANDPGLHAAAEWLLRTWKQHSWLEQVNEKWANDGKQRHKRLIDFKKRLANGEGPAAGLPMQWYVNSQGQTMVMIPGPVEFVMGSPRTEPQRYDDEIPHMKRIGRSFAIAANAVTIEQFRHFAKDYGLPTKFSRAPQMPAVGITWHSAASYCNWLSEREGIDKDQWCYETDARGDPAKLKENYLSLTGYRLPTETEMEYATRAGAVTSRFYGETEELLAKYAWYQKNSQDQTWPVGSLKPNDFGLFDVHGNVFNWCQEHVQPYPSTHGDKVFEDRELKLVVLGTLGRVMRGGSFLNLPSRVRSAYRFVNLPNSARNDVGFRPARTLPLGLTIAPSAQE